MTNRLEETYADVVERDVGPDVEHAQQNGHGERNVQEDEAHMVEEEVPAWERPRGPITRHTGEVCIGRIGAPPENEATSGRFFFWVPDGALVEDTQLVTCNSVVAGRRLRYYAVIDEVRRRSDEHGIDGAKRIADGDLEYEPHFNSEGCTYASASVLRTDPPVLTPPRERSEVLLATHADSLIAYSADEITNSLPCGLVKNGADNVIGPGYIDLDYLLGTNGGHMNVNGAAGRGTKSSYLLFINWLLLWKARQEQTERPSDPERLRIVPIILNVKNFDLFHIDRRSSRYDPAKHLRDWQDLGVDAPQPFQNVTFFAAQQPGNALPMPTGRTGEVQPYSWSLRDIVERGLFPYLFAEADANDSNFSTLVLDLQNWLTREQVEHDGSVRRSLENGRPRTFQALLEWVRAQATETEDHRVLRGHHVETWKKLNRRFVRLTYENRGILRRDDERGHPLDVVRADTSDPQVIDLAALAGEPELQRFVVATILRQIVEARTGANAVRGLRYLVTLDELNRFAPRGATDPITRLIEMVAAEMRSQGVILLGAQQQASKISEKVFENSAIKVLGKSGTLELNATVWGILSKSARIKAQNLALDEKLVVQDNFREPMHVRVPFPVWAMNPNEAGLPPVATGGADDFSDLIDP